MPAFRYLDVDSSAGVTVVRLKSGRVADEQQVHELGRELFAVVADQPNPRLVVSFADIGFLSSAALGKLITLQRKVDQKGGRLVLCGLNRDTLETLAVSKLDNYFQISHDEHAALDALRG